MEYVPARRVSLKAHPIFSEKWLQQLIAEDPTVLGLGELTVRDVERSQPHAGRLDLLLSDPVAGTRYEVEIQLGSTDEVHIVRTIEYWDIERGRYPQYDHVAVLVAEDITSRFLNVIRLFNKAIPVIAIQLNALEVDGKLTLDATTVLNVMRRGTDEEDDPGQTVDRGYWESRFPPAAMKVVDDMHDLIRTTANDPSLMLKYNKKYIGLARSGVADNFVKFFPRRNGKVLTTFRVEPSEELMSRIEETDPDLDPGFNPRTGRCFVRLAHEDPTRHRDILSELIVKPSDTFSVENDQVEPASDYPY